MFRRCLRSHEFVSHLSGFSSIKAANEKSGSIRCLSRLSATPQIRLASSSSSSSSTPETSHRPLGSWSKRRKVVLTIAASILIIAGYDEYNSHILSRNIYTLYTGMMIAADYRFRFNADDPESVKALHERCADRLMRCIERNGGLFTKAGQAIGVQAAILPPPYAVLAKLFDEASFLDPGLAEKVIESELGRKIENIFSEWNPVPIAAASIAQVHVARLKSGEEVAVKVQRPQIRRQAKWDLMAFRALLKAHEWIFELPISFAGQYISDEILLETKFLHEAENSITMRQHVQGDAHLSKFVYVPKIYSDLTTDRVLVMEYISGAHKLTDKKALSDMKLSAKSVMTSVCEVFAAMIFKYGFVQADPHPSNVLVRQNPDNPKRHQIVLLDHGLVIQLPELFRSQYCDFWKAITIFDTKTISNICSSWGIGNTELFASATLLRPFKTRGPASPEQIARRKKIEANQSPSRDDMKAALKTFLLDYKLLPKELIFVGRSMKLIQANNQSLGSPVNRLKINALYAASGSSNPSNRANGHNSVTNYISTKANYVLFRLALFNLDAVFFLSQALNLAKSWIFFRHTSKRGFEDDLEDQMRSLAKSQAGVDLPPGAFSG